jgi:hypothetical protein
MNVRVRAWGVENDAKALANTKEQWPHNMKIQNRTLGHNQIEL